MASEDAYIIDPVENLEDKVTNPAISSKTNALAARISNVLAASYADSEIRDALHTLDARNLRNSPEARRNLRIDAQKELISRNGEILQDFGQVAEVCLAHPP